MGCLLDSLEHAYRVLGFEDAADGDEMSAQLVMARIIEPSSKLDSLRVLEEVGAAASYRTVTRRLRLCEGLVAAADLRCLRGVRWPGAGQPDALRRLHAVFETEAGDGFRKAGFRRSAGWSRRLRLTDLGQRRR
jgi:hypothetical protein